ncbi:MAG TPA: cell division protein CrgA [Jatrophihabitantaceae bacterium]
MPKSKVRKKNDYAPRPASSSSSLSSSSSAGRGLAPSPSWYPIVMVVVLVIGLAWIAVYYIAGDKVPVIEDIGAWNFAVAFGIMMVGLIMAVRWR